MPLKPLMHCPHNVEASSDGAVISFVIGVPLGGLCGAMSGGEQLAVGRGKWAIWISLPLIPN